MTPYATLVTAIYERRAYYEELIRTALRDAGQAEPSLLTDGWGDPLTLEQFVEFHLYDLDGLPLDNDPSIKWCYGQMYAADELVTLIESLTQTTQPLRPISPPGCEPTTSPRHHPITADAAHATLRAGGFACPRCGGVVVTETATHDWEGARYQQMRCDACEQAWTNVWTVARVLVYDQGEHPDTFILPPAGYRKDTRNDNTPDTTNGADGS